MPRDDEKNLAIRTYGHRIFEGQTLPEYLLEFALVFLADKPEKDPSLGSSGRFPTRRVAKGELEYSTDARIGLKRFIFFERSKQQNRLKIDQYAYQEMRKLLEGKIECDDDLTATQAVDIIQELFYGYNAVLLNRSWFAQSLLPVSRMLIFPEAMRRSARNRSFRRYGVDNIDVRDLPEVDTEFDFNSYLFLARGGEVYYLHVLTGLLQTQDAELRYSIEEGLSQLFDSRPELSRLAYWIQHTWDEYMGYDGHNERKITKTCQWIPTEYEIRASYTCRELASFLQARMDALQKIELLSLGVVIQILRMMHDRAGALVKRTITRPAWIVHVPGCASNDVKSLATRSYQQCEDDLFGALYTQKHPNESPDELREMVAKAAHNAHLLFRKLGKAAGLVVPPKGSNMRFSVSEDLLKFFVLALIEPGEKMLLSDFLSKLYEHFGIIIGSSEFSAYQEENQINSSAIGDSSLLRANEEAFKDMLKACGFLRDLSDATAIVENPFGGGQQ